MGFNLAFKGLISATPEIETGKDQIRIIAFSFLVLYPRGFVGIAWCSYLLKCNVQLRHRKISKIVPVSVTRMSVKQSTVTCVRFVYVVTRETNKIANQYTRCNN